MGAIKILTGKIVPFKKPQNIEYSLKFYLKYMKIKN